MLNSSLLTVHSGGRYSITAAGALHIRDAGLEESYVRYYCETTHKLTGERKLSPPSQVIVSGEFWGYLNQTSYKT